MMSPSRLANGLKQEPITLIISHIELFTIDKVRKNVFRRPYRR